MATTTTSYTKTLTLTSYTKAYVTFEVVETETTYLVRLKSLRVTNSRSGGTTAKTSWKLYATASSNSITTSKLSGDVARSSDNTMVSRAGNATANGMPASLGNVSVPKGVTDKTYAVTGTAVTATKAKAATSLPYLAVAAYFVYDGGNHFAAVSQSWSIPAKASYAVTYDANGASGTTTAQTKWHNEALALRSALARSGWEWVGWGTSATATTAAYKAGASYTGNAALKLYAITKRTLTLAYSANGGAGAPASQSATVYNKTTSYAFKVASGAPTRAGYRFRGWATSAARANAGTIDQAAGSSKTLSANATLYAVWSAVEPTLSVGRAYRADSHGNPNSMGTYLAVEAAYSLSSAAGSHAWGVTVTDGSAAVTASTAETDAGGVATFLVDANLAAATRYAVAVTLTDDLGTVLRSDSVTMTAEVPSAAPPISLAPGGLGVTIGAQAVLQTGFDVRMEQFAYGSKDHPLFVWSSAPTDADTFPYSPCLVYVPAENALYFCTND